MSRRIDAHVVAPLVGEAEIEQIGAAERIGLRDAEDGDGDEAHHQQPEEGRLEQRGQPPSVTAPAVGVHPCQSSQARMPAASNTMPASGARLMRHARLAPRLRPSPDR